MKTIGALSFVSVLWAVLIVLITLL